jgi:rare lipoprotein A
MRATPARRSAVLLLAAVAALTGCRGPAPRDGGSTGDGGAMPVPSPGVVPPPPRPGAAAPSAAELLAMPDAVPRVEPRSRAGNPPFYDVLGKRYFVLAQSEGYRERGVASWYGPTFHEKQTSNGEPYDMYGMTAAHKTLPLPSYVRVTNLSNGRRVVLRVNDRGPFVGTRLIDLSYTAALKLDMLRAGTALVEVEVVTPGSLGEAATSIAAAGGSGAGAVPGSAAGGGSALAGPRLFVQAGAFGVAANAEALAARLRAAGIPGVQLLPPGGASRLHRVRVGPIDDVAGYDRLIGRLAGLGLTGRLATD